MDLPTDYFGIHIENERDMLRLQYLLSKKGEDKVRLSVSKYKDKYPESKPYVSTLLKWHNISVPSGVYNPKDHPVRHYIYILTLLDHSVCKLGFTSNIIKRGYSIHKDGLSTEIFDLRSSILKRCFNKKSALELEKTLKNNVKCSDHLCPYRHDEPTGFYWGSCGRSEWFKYDYLAVVKDILNNYDTGLTAYRLDEWLRNKK